MNEQDTQSELDWLAFCYAAGDLSGEEAAQFETRLADDQTAREALARAVELSQVVAAVEAQSEFLVTPVARIRSDWHTRLSWMAIGGVASLLIALLWSGVVGPTWRRLDAGNRQQLALAWNMTRTEMAEVKEAGVWLPTVMGEMDDDSVVEASIEEVAVEESPSWLTAAVFARSNDNSNEPGEPHQRLEN
jgi:anti-sigma-K factor RskA